MNAPQVGVVSQNLVCKVLGYFLVDVSLALLGVGSELVPFLLLLFLFLQLLYIF